MTGEGPGTSDATQGGFEAGAGGDGHRPAGLSRGQSYLPELESLRGWAILIVVLYHAEGLIFGVDRMGTDVAVPYAFISAGHSGVTLFFILSAFLLARPFLRGASSSRSVQPGRFFQRRILRIMPLYAVAILVGVVLSGATWEVARDGVWALFFLNSIDGTSKALLPYSAVWWSLATEAQFYLLLPLLGLALRSGLGRAIAGVAFLAWAAAYGLFLMTPHAMDMGVRIQLSLSVLGRAPAFLVGILVSWVVMRFGDPLRAWGAATRWFARGGADLILLGTLFGLGVLLRWVTSEGFFPSEIKWTGWHLPESLLWGGVVLLVLVAPLQLKRLFANRILAWLGLISYSLYLVHYPVLFFWVTWLGEQGFSLKEQPLERLGAVVVGVAFCALVSWGTYRWIERPFLLRKARID